MQGLNRGCGRGQVGAGRLAAVAGVAAAGCVRCARQDSTHAAAAARLQRDVLERGAHEAGLGALAGARRARRQGRGRQGRGVGRRHIDRRREPGHGPLPARCANHVDGRLLVVGQHRAVLPHAGLQAARRARQVGGGGWRRVSQLHGCRRADRLSTAGLVPLQAKVQRLAVHVSCAHHAVVFGGSRGQGPWGRAVGLHTALHAGVITRCSVPGLSAPAHSSRCGGAVGTGCGSKRMLMAAVACDQAGSARPCAAGGGSALRMPPLPLAMTTGECCPSECWDISWM